MSYRAIERHVVEMIRTFKILDQRDRPHEMFPDVQGQAVHSVDIAQPEILQQSPDRLCIVSYKDSRPANRITTGRVHDRFYKTEWDLLLECYFLPEFGLDDSIQADPLLLHSYNATLGQRMRELYDELARRPTMSYIPAGMIRPTRYKEWPDDWESTVPTPTNPWGRNSSQIVDAGPAPVGSQEVCIFAGPFARYVKIDVLYRVNEGYQLTPIL